MNLVKSVALVTMMGSVVGAYAAEPMQPSGVAEVMMSNSEKDFFETANSSNLFEIQAAKLAQTKSSDPKVKSYADKMISDHTEAENNLASLAKTKNVALAPTLLKRHQSMLDSLNKDEAGAAFDKDYASKMVISHKEAVSLFDKTSKKAKDPDIKSLAAMTLPKLQMHGGMAHDLKTAKS